MNADAKICLLIAEDDDAAAHLIKANLSRAGLPDSLFLRAKDGEEALDILEGRSPQRIPQEAKIIVLLDIRMPKVDGVQVLKKMKSSSELRKIPVIMLTTSDRPKEVELCYQAGCNLYLKKQVDYAKFTDSISKLAAFISACELPLFGEITYD